MLREIYDDRGTRPNAPKTHKSRKPNPHEEKFVTRKVQGQMHLRRVNRKNPTYVKRNLP